jgi:hypothetical protein
MFRSKNVWNLKKVQNCEKSSKSEKKVQNVKKVQCLKKSSKCEKKFNV